MENKEVYREKIEAKLGEWNAELDKLSSKMKEAKADAKLEYAEKIEEFKAKRDELKNKLSELKESGDDAWEGVKAKVEKAASDLMETLKKAKSSIH